MKTLRPGTTMTSVHGAFAAALMSLGLLAGCAHDSPGPLAPTSSSSSVPDLSGIYTLTIDRGSCDAAQQFPDTVRTRTYVATVRQYGRELGVDLAGAEFANGLSHFGGHVGSADAMFSLNSGSVTPWDYSDPALPDVAERLPDGFLSFSGAAIAMLVPGGLSGTLNGSFTIYDALAVGGGPVRSQCHSNAHKFALMRKAA